MGTLTDALEDSVHNKFGGETVSKQTRVSHPIYSLLPTEVEGFDSLAELALDMRWSWNHATAGVWRTLDPILWELTQNPWVVLQTVSRDQLERVRADPAFRRTIDDLLQAKRHAAERPAGFQQKHPQSPFGEVKVETRGEQHVFEAQVCLNGLGPQAVRVELYADGINGGDLVREEILWQR
jgi:hypothetical protein